MDNKHDDDDDKRPFYPYQPMGYPPMMQRPVHKNSRSDDGMSPLRIVTVILIVAGFMSGDPIGWLMAGLLLFTLQ